MAQKTFVMKKGGQPGIIPLGTDRLHVEPGKPFTVEGEDVRRFEESPDYDEVKEQSHKADEPKETKTK